MPPEAPGAPLAIPLLFSCGVLNPPFWRMSLALTHDLSCDDRIDDGIAEPGIGATPVGPLRIDALPGAAPILGVCEA